MGRAMRLIAALLLLAAAPAQADHAIAMHGAPKYPAHFKQFDYVNPDAPKGGTLRLGVTGAFDNVNPFALRGRAAFGANAVSGQLYLYDSLLARGRDEPFTLYGLIAEDVQSPPDRSRVTFRLNPAARFHDGSRITSADVVFSWQNFRDHGRPNQRVYYGKVVRAEAPDEAQVTFHFKPDANGLYNRELPLIMGLMQIIPEHGWSKTDLTAPSLTPELGSGPYKIKSIDPGRSIIWERVRDYWGRDLPSQRGLYNFDQIRVDYYRNQQAALLAFKAGQYDLRLEGDPARWANAYEGPAKESGQYQLADLPHGRIELRAYALNLRRPLFQDRALRRAINMGFDFDWVNRVLFYGQYRRSASMFPNSHLAAQGLPGAAEQKLLEPFRDRLPPELFTQPFTPPGGAIKEFPARLRAAQRLLQEGGYQWRGGKLYSPKNEPVAFTILLGDAHEEKVALHLARHLRELGMEVAVRVLDSAQFQARQNNFDYDVMLVRWVNSLSPGNEQRIYWGSAAADQPGTRNYPGIKNPAVDHLIDAMTSAASREDLTEAVHALDRVLSWDYAVVPLYYLPVDHIGVSSALAWPKLLPADGYMLESWWRKPEVER